MEVVFHQKTPQKNTETLVSKSTRGELHQVVFDHAKDDQGIPIHLGQIVSKSFENDVEAGIVLKSGERIVADAVVGADCVRSKARALES